MAKQHARYSPSSLDSLNLCIRFKYRQTDTSNDAASEGTELHEACEHETTAGLNEEQAECVNACIDYRNSLLATEGGKDSWEIIKERRWTLEDLTFGHADEVLLHKEKPIAHVIDFKFTRRQDNHDFQVRTYGAAVFEELFLSKGIEDATIIAHVVSPRLRVIDKTEHAGKILHAQVRQEIEELYARIEDPFNPPTPHPEVCEKCDRSSRCPAITKAIIPVAEGLGLPLPEKFAPDAIVSVRDRAIAHVLAGALSNWADQVKKANNEFAKAGNDVPGFTLRSRSTGLRAPAEATPIIVKALKDAGYADDEILGACTFSVSKFAKQQTEVSDKKVADVKEEMQALVGEHLVEGNTQFLQKSKRMDDFTALLEAAKIS